MVGMAGNVTKVWRHRIQNSVGETLRNGLWEDDLHTNLREIC
jgi:hypothetical protein